jgi:hypothetical protein
LYEEYQWLKNAGVVLDEVVIEGGKTEKVTNIIKVARWFSILSSTNLLQIHLDSLCANDKT